jgi:hypothetical protein
MPNSAKTERVVNKTRKNLKSRKTVKRAKTAKPKEAPKQLSEAERFEEMYPTDKCESCGIPWELSACSIDWEPLGYSDPCDDCCCGSCGGRKKFCGGCN